LSREHGLVIVIKWRRIMLMHKRITYVRDGRAPIPAKEITSHIMSLIHAKHTRPELLLRKALRVAKLKDYKLHWAKMPGSPDISFPKARIAIFVNGCYWHRCPKCDKRLPKTHTRFWEEKFERNVARDKRKARELRKLGWKVLIVWECKIKRTIQKIVKRIARHIKK
jgi:DNA mismatch endonuclease (patch repair protein)